MKRLVLLILCTAAVSPSAFADQAAAMAVLQAGCTADAQKFCSNVASGGGRIIACLKQNRDQLSDQCKQAAGKAQAMLNGGAAPPAAPMAAPPTAAASPAEGGATYAAMPAPAAAATAATSTHTTMKKGSKAAPGSYVLVKKVQVIDPGMANVAASQPAYELMVPKDWSFQGTVNLGGAKDGCFADLMAVSWDAESPDRSVGFSGLPTYSWQYSNNPTELKNLSDPNRRALGVGGKPCPVAKPMKAEDYLKQIVLPNLKGTTLVSVEPFPELSQMARAQWGLGASGSGSVQTDAVRMRVDTTKDGKPAEAWLSVVVVTQAFQVNGGTFWNSQAIDFTALVALKGQLDANDKLYRLMITTVQPLPKWQTYANSQIKRLDDAEAQKEAKIDQMIAQFQEKVANTINQVTANSMKGSNTSVFTEGQVLRNVQTYRDPSTGKLMELSNQYNHAWANSNGSEYALSDDPSFNPGTAFGGSWDELEVVHPAP